MAGKKYKMYIALSLFLKTESLHSKNSVSIFYKSICMDVR